MSISQERTEALPRGSEAPQPSATPEPARLTHAEVAMLASVGVLMCILLGKLAVRAVSDPDTWLHLRIGSFLLDGGRFTRADPWSAANSTAYVPTQWLPEVTGAWVERHAGLPGIAMLMLLGALALFLALVYACRALADPVPATLAASFGLLGAGGGVSTRPQLVAFVFLALTVGAWWRSNRDGKPRWWLVPMTWVWACCHGLWVVGVGFGIGMAVYTVVVQRSTSRKAPLLAVAFLSLASVTVTPLGLRAATAPFTVTAAVGQFVQEWQPMTVHNPFLSITLALGLLITLLWVRAGRRVPLLEIVVLVVGLVAALTMGRLIAVGAILLAPLLAGGLQHLRHRPRSSVTRIELVVWSLTSVAVLVTGLVRAPIVATEPEMTPVSLAPHVRAIPKDATVFDDQGLSGWLMWVDPDIHLTIDLRSEIYSAEHIRGYVKAAAAYPGWDDYVAASGADYAVLEDDSPIGYAFGGLAGWSRVASSDGYTIWRHAGAP